VAGEAEKMPKAIATAWHKGITADELQKATTRKVIEIKAETSADAMRQWASITAAAVVPVPTSIRTLTDLVAYVESLGPDDVPLVDASGKPVEIVIDAREEGYEVRLVPVDKGLPTATPKAEAA
jgi:hypothetical protein